jgi:eukaryotic-like serine/threonine-protein kinase
MKNILINFALFLLILISVYLLVDLAILPSYTRQNEEFSLIDFNGLSLESAEKKADSLNLELLVRDSSFSTLVPMGHIVSQYPNPYTTVKEGRKIYLTISNGDRPILVPELIGLSEKRARFLLEDLNLELGQIRTAYSQIYPKNTIMNQGIEKGKEVLSGTKVDLVMSLGRDFSEQRMPDLRNRTFEKAKELAMRQGIKVEKKLGARNDKIVPGTVIAQSVLPGTMLSEGQIIILTVSQ